MNGIISLIITASKFGWPVAVLFFLLWLYSKPEIFLKWCAVWNKLSAPRSSKAEKKYISQDIQARINSFTRNLNRQSGNVMPFDLKINWVKQDEIEETLVKHNNVIIKMKHYTSQDQNIATAVNEYLSKSLIPQARSCVHRPILKSIDFKMALKIFDECKLYSTSQHFSKHFLAPAIISERKIEKYLEKLDTLDLRGLFTRVLLPELLYLGIKTPQRSSPRYEAGVKQETEQFINFLDDIALRERGEDVELLFSKARLRVAIILIAKSATLRYGKDPYTLRFRKHLRKGFDRIYIVAAEPNIRFTIDIIRSLEKDFKISARKILQRHFKAFDPRNKLVKYIYAVFENTGTGSSSQ